MQNRRFTHLRQATGLAVALLLALSYGSPAQRTLRQLPDKLVLTQGQLQTLELGAPLRLSLRSGDVAVAASDDETLGDVTLSSETAGTSELLLSLMGVLPLRRVEVEVQPERRLIPGGQAIGVALRTEGVMLVGAGDLNDGMSPATLSGLKAGDVILRVEGESIRTSRQLSEIIERAGERPLSVDFRRGGESLHTTLTPRMDEAAGVVRMGAWVRDSTAGVGTVSFYDPATGAYAALGHAISDGDTGAVLPVGEGKILEADIVAVQKGQRGAPGELKGSFLRDPQVLGDIRRNTVLGLYGHMDAPPAQSLYPDGLPIGLRSGVHTGPASILSTVGVGGLTEYAVEITRVNPQDAPAPKSMVIRVTDPRLLDATGGIVQGMSGSPILQDGRIIGAVTHVFVADPQQGYGLYIDWMLQEANTL